MCLKEELTKLKAFTLLVVKEQQRLKDLLEDQSSCIRELTAITNRISEDPSAANSHPNKYKSPHLQVEQSS